MPEAQILKMSVRRYPALNWYPKHESAMYAVIATIFMLALLLNLVYCTEASLHYYRHSASHAHSGPVYCSRLDLCIYSDLSMLNAVKLPTPGDRSTGSPECLEQRQAVLKNSRIMFLSKYIQRESVQQKACPSVYSPLQHRQNPIIDVQQPMQRRQRRPEQVRQLYLTSRRRRSRDEPLDPAVDPPDISWAFQQRRAPPLLPAFHARGAPVHRARAKVLFKPKRHAGVGHKRDGETFGTKAGAARIRSREQESSATWVRMAQ